MCPVTPEFILMKTVMYKQQLREMLKEFKTSLLE